MWGFPGFNGGLHNGHTWPDEWWKLEVLVMKFGDKIYPTRSAWFTEHNGIFRATTTLKDK